MAVTKTVTSFPQTVNLTFLTNPAGLQVYDGDDGANQPTPVTRPVIIGSTVSVSAPTPQVFNGTGYAFVSWSDGGAQSHDITAPATAASYTATYTNTGVVALASDSFNRTAASGGWGTADVGGAWTVNPAAQFALTGTGGTLSNPTAGKTGSALLGVSARDVDVSFSVASDRIPTGFGQYPAAIIRHQAGGQEYWVKLHVSNTGAVFLSASSWSGTAETSLGPDVATGLTQVAGVPINIRVDVSGINPTTITARAWATGTTEPATWPLSITNATAALQAAGTLGLRATTSGSTTNSPTLFTFDSYVVNSLGGTPPPPPPSTIATDTWTRTVAGGWGSASLGGPWTLVGGNPAFAADGTGGTIQIATAGSRRYAVLAGPSALNTDETFTIASDKVVVGSGQYVYAILRHQAGGSSTGARSTSGDRRDLPQRQRLQRDGRGRPGTGGQQRPHPGPRDGGQRPLPGHRHKPGDDPWPGLGRWSDRAHDLDVLGHRPRRPLLQVAGSVGLRATTSSTSTNVPITFRFDNLTVLDLGAGATPTVLRVQSSPLGVRARSSPRPPRLQSHPGGRS